jgi:hypothetical protein
VRERAGGRKPPDRGVMHVETARDVHLRLASTQALDSFLPLVLRELSRPPLPRLEMRPRMVRSPVDICLGTRPSQAEKSRRLANATPLPIAATIALETIGPIPRTVITLRQLSSLFANALDLIGHGFNSLV